MIRNLKLFFSIIFYFFLFINPIFSETVNEIKISGNDRITSETITMFSGVKKGDDLNNENLNEILKSLYKTNFFNNISLKLANNIFTINVDEAPIIQNINITGIKASKYKDLTRDVLKVKPKNSYIKTKLSDEVDAIKNQLKLRGFYFAEVNVLIENLDNNLVNIEYNINLGEKSKISKITFIGDKIYKDKKLKSIIISEEFKYWKFISGKKYLQEQLIDLDKRLLTSYYLNNGFYNIKVNSSFAKMIRNNEFELIFNIDPGKKIFFNKLTLDLPDDFEKNNYSELNKLLAGLKDEPYSINSVEKILDEIDKTTIQEEFKTVKAYSKETIVDNKLNIDFIIEEANKVFVEKINIFGNNITQENVIRNQLQIDEGDPFSDLLTKKSEINIKGLNFFKKVKTSVVDGRNEDSKIINIEVQEKPTGEITAGAGAGTEGGSVTFGVKENNYLGRGISLNTNATVSDETFKGQFRITKPNYKESDKTVSLSFEATETDKLKDYGYKTNKNGFSLGTSFEYYDDFFLGLSALSFFEKIETNSTASAAQKKQKGNYFDSFVGIDLNLDKRNQKYKPSDGYYSNYKILIPTISDTNTFTNTYDYKVYSELFNENVSSFSLLLSSATSLSSKDIKLSERLFVPSNRLRGFERGKIGPKDGKDYVGGNYLAAINFQSNLPMFFENSENLDAVIFLDAANVWGLDYDSSIEDGSKVRSSIGVGIDWLTAVGPLNFSLTQVITKQNTDKKESFRFNLGTTF